MINFRFFFYSIFLGIGLAMDAFSVSLANGLNEPKMKKSKMSLVASIFAFFQFLMPLLGWGLVHTLINFFKFFESFIPCIALILLLFIGIKMLIEGIKNKEETKNNKVGFISLLVQGIATSIDALSVGFTTTEYNISEALLSSLIIGIVTFIICLIGLIIGKKFGTKLSNKASILGGIILILIGIEIFITGII